MICVLFSRVLSDEVDDTDQEIENAFSEYIHKQMTSKFTKITKAMVTRAILSCNNCMQELNM